MAQYELFDFDEYSDQLSPANAAKVDEIAADIAASRDGSYPVVSVVVTGYADKAWNVPAAERDAFEMKVSVNRANVALARLQSAIRARGGEAATEGIQFAASGHGSNFRAVPNPQSDAERRRNRRVVIDVYRRQDSPIRPLPPMPPLPPPDPSDDPNVIYAGTNFRIKLMDGAAIGQGLGGFGYFFVIWDVDNSRAAVYFYTGFAGMAGFSSPLQGESDWASFSTATPVQVDQFGGFASHVVLTAPASFMRLTFPHAAATLDLGFGWVGAIASGHGPFTYVSGSVKVYRGD